MTVNLPPEVQQFNCDVQLLLQLDEPYARSLQAFIHQTLRQFRLEGYFTALDVFTEAYLRGIQYTHQGKPIFRPHAWLKRTAYNIIREWQRERSRYCDAALDDLLDQGAVSYHDEFPAETMPRDEIWIGTEMQRVMRAFSALEERDRILIYWNIVEALPWQVIHDQLVAAGNPSTPLPTLRKRGQRALERLRREYHQQE